MSYPGPSGQPPQNPYGNNPYGQQPQQQPSYGYPQQQSGYGYPQQPQSPQANPYGQYPAYGQGPGGVPAALPGKTNAARLMLFIGGGIQTLVMIIALIGLSVAANQVEEVYSDVRLGLGVIYVFAVIFLLIGALGIYLGTQFNNGGNAIRIWGIVWGSLIALSGLSAIGAVFGILWIALGIVTIVLLAQSESASWFNRPRY